MNKRSEKLAAASRFAYAGLDRVIHEHARLSMLTSLISHPAGLSFGELKSLCALTDGNLSRHLQVLESEKLVTSARTMQGSRPITRCRITPFGRKRYLEYVEVLERVLQDASKAVKERGRAAAAPLQRRISEI